MNTSLVARYTTLVCYSGLLLSYLVWSLNHGPDMLAAAIVLWLLVCSGLLLVAYGLFKGSRRSYQWLCFILLIYFIHVIISLFEHQNPNAEFGEHVWVSYLRLVLIVGCFCASMLAARWFQARPE